MSTKRRTIQRRTALGAAVTLAILASPLPAAAFKPSATTTGYVAGNQSHDSITRAAIKLAHAAYFGISTPTRAMDAATKQLSEADQSIDNLFEDPATFWTDYYHFDDERFTTARGLLLEELSLGVDLLAAGDGKGARVQIGRMLHTIQDFYTHTNWVEAGNTSPSEWTRFPFNPVSKEPIAPGATCVSCEGTDYNTSFYFSFDHVPQGCVPINATNSCFFNLTTTTLTSGYFDLHDEAVKPAGKCSHGGARVYGAGDVTAYVTPFGGINKDTTDCRASPHYYNHFTAATAAQAATKAFFDDIKARPDVTPAMLKLLFGVGPTVAFAIDVSGSMQSIINATKNRVKQIIDYKINVKGEDPLQYVLVPFNDPACTYDFECPGGACVSGVCPGVVAAGPVTATKSRATFEGDLDYLFASGGGDCPERAHTGLLKAVGAADPAGELFLYTDATSKDGYLINQILAIAKKKEIKIHPLLFGSCSPIDPGYIRAAAETGGQLFFVSPGEAEEVSEAVDLAISSNKVDILSIGGASGPQTFTVPVDSTLTRVSFSVSGSPSVTVTRPDGTVVSAGDSGVTLVTLSSGVIATIDAPLPGAWEVGITGFGPLSVSVTGDSALRVAELDFVEERGRPLHEGLFALEGEPFENQPNDVRVHMTGAFSSMELELWSKAGALLQGVSLTEGVAPEDGVFSGTASLPVTPFLAYAKGIDTNGFPYQRAVPRLFETSTVRVDKQTPAKLQRAVPNEIHFKVTNLGAADTFEIQAADDKDYVTAIDPTTVSLGVGESAAVTVTLEPPGWDPLESTCRHASLSIL